MKLKNIINSAKHCKKCRGASHFVPELEYSKNAPEILIVLERPGRGAKEQITENNNDPAASNLKLLINTSPKLCSDNFLITNACLCKGNKPPNIQEIRNCNEYLIKQISIIKPRIIVACGMKAVKAIEIALNISPTKGFSIKKYAGCKYPGFSREHLYFYVQYHPSNNTRHIKLSMKLKHWEKMKRQIAKELPKLINS